MRRPLEKYRVLRLQIERLGRISEADRPDTAFEQLEWLSRDLGFDYAGVGVIVDTNEPRLDLPGRAGVGVLGLGNLTEPGAKDLPKRFQRHLSVLKMGAKLFANTMVSATGSDHRSILSATEHRVLTLQAKGLSPREIAEQEQKSLATVRQQLTSARNRLGARSVSQAVAIAAELGLIRGNSR